MNKFIEIKTDVGNNFDVAVVSIDVIKEVHKSTDGKVVIKLDEHGGYLIQDEFFYERFKSLSKAMIIPSKQGA